MPQQITPRLQPASAGQVTSKVKGTKVKGKPITALKLSLPTINETAARKVQREVGENVAVAKCDVTQWTQNLGLFRHTHEKYGKIDIVVLNAVEDPEVVLANDPATDITRESDGQDSPLKPPTTKIFDVNIAGYMYGMKLAVHYLAKNSGGYIITVGSSTSFVAIPIEPLYVASKHAELGLARATSQMSEVREKGIAIGFVAPFLVRSPLTQYVVDLDFLRKNCPLSEMEDVTNAVGIILTTPIDKANGMSVCILGQTLTELEAPVSQHVQSLLF
ncbi:hypothetical protein ACJZ2D_000911 [Fusarium nematophilum]